VITAAAALAVAVVWLVLPARADDRCRRLTSHATDRRAEPPAETETARVAAIFDLMAAALDAGLPPGQALSAVASAMPTGPRTQAQQAAAMLELSAEPRTVWELLATDEALGPLGQALVRADQSGAPVAEAVRVLADEARRSDRSERLERARRVGVRTAAPLGLCFLPAFLLVAVVPTIIGLIGDVF
jgi:hypothetical protein